MAETEPGDGCEETHNDESEEPEHGESTAEREGALQVSLTLRHADVVDDEPELLSDAEEDADVEPLMAVPDYVEHTGPPAFRNLDHIDESTTKHYHRVDDESPAIPQLFDWLPEFYAFAICRRCLSWVDLFIY